ncbi:lysosomal acid phosphatase [Gadus macrocephalus]|uniref:lysosomal acid phosphatase n=1 Tax=Gadus macrocephalus TaxID=80720 RepID=UPI0028CB50E1|nr:lysosomal acid phosphatase [Gadus macrocephalus]
MLPGAVLVLLALGFSAVDQAAAERRLVYVTVLFRHGDRSPVKAYPTDPYQESAWPQGFGQLSQEGMRQHYNLGQFLRVRYNGFLNETYDRREVHVRSTDYDRTLMSAEANLAALYPPSGQQIFNPDLKWQPIPVHTVPQDQETLLSFPTDKCPRYKQLMTETEKSPEFVNMTTKYSDFMEMVHNKTGQLNTSVETVWSVYDTLFCESRHNLTAPAWVTEDVMDKLKILKDFAFQIMFDIYKHQEKCRLQGGVLLGEIVKNLSKRAELNSNEPLKMMMLSAHDTTVVALQSSMSVFNGIQPPYASCHMIELYREDNGSMSVSMFYRNDSSLPEPYPVALPGCSQDCPLEDYIRITGPFIPDDLEKECQVPSAFNDKEVVVALAVSSALLVFLLVLITALLCRQKQPITSQGYRHVTNQEGLGGEYHS